MEKYIEKLKTGKPLIIFDRLNEKEGDIVFPSETILKEDITFMLNNCKGVICQTLTEDIIEKNNIPLLEKRGNNITGQTNFVCPVDHINSHSGISSEDRLMIIKELINDNIDKNNIVTPGHQTILKISKNGLADRQGHTESSSYLVKQAGFKESAVICEIMNDEGKAMDLEEINIFSKKFNIDIIMLDEIYNFFLKNITIKPDITLYKNPYFYLKNKNVIISGSSSGIGKKIKEDLEKQGCNIILNLNRSNGIDVTDFNTMGKYLEKVDKIDILINCAGYIDTEKIEDMTLENWNKHVNTNLTSIFFIINKLIPKFNDIGCIINISSPSANKIRKGWSAYCCTKAALNSFTLNCAEELKEKNIFINAVSPTKTNTPMIKKLFPDIKEEDLIKPGIISNFVNNIICEMYNKKITGKIFNIK